VRTVKVRLTAAIVALVLAGCGGGDEPKPKPTAPSAQQDAPKQPGDAKSKTVRFIEKADEICASFNDRWVGVPEATTEYYRDWKQSNADLEALNAPARISSDWNRYLSALEQQIRFTEAENGLELKQAYERKEKAAQKIGLTDCSAAE
jgi:hypothetical protein